MVTNLLLTASLLSSIPTNWNSNVEVRFRVVDDAGLIVSNAVISTNTQRDRLANLGHADSPQRKIMAITDTNGCARIEFPCYSGEFSSYVSAMGFYPEHKKNLRFNYARDSVFFAHLLEHEKHLSFTMRKKLNPIPCFGYGAGEDFPFPLKNGRFGFDMEKGDWTVPHGKGEVADFILRREESNGVYRAVLEFEGPFNGAYKQKQESSTSFKSTYRADTNHVYVQTMDIWTKKRMGKETVRSQFVSDEEYLVIRSRSVVDADGNLKSCNYSKIYGGITAYRYFQFMTMVFNPKKNDANLEFDTQRNLRRRTSGILLP
mgnify:CR=1 FL=1